MGRRLVPLNATHGWPRRLFRGHVFVAPPSLGVPAAAAIAAEEDASRRKQTAREARTCRSSPSL